MANRKPKIPGLLLLTTGDASKRIGITPEAVKWAASEGNIKCHAWTPSRQRLFLPQEIERFIKWRAARLGSPGRPVNGNEGVTLSTAVAAKLVGFTPTSLREAVKAGHLPAYDLLGNKWMGDGRHCFFRRADVMRYIRDRDQAGLITRVGAKRAYRTRRAERRRA